MEPQSPLTRKEIAAGTHTSIPTVIRREKQWGIDRCRLNALFRPLLYDRQRVNEALLSRNIIGKPI